MRPTTDSYVRRTLTRAQAAEAAAYNLRGFRNEDALAILAADLICDSGNGHQTLSMAIQNAVTRQNAATLMPLSSAAGLVPEINLAAIEEFLLAILSPSRIEDVEGEAGAQWLGLRVDEHADALHRLGSTHPSLYRALFEPTLEHAVRIGKRSDIDRAQLERLLAEQAKLILIGAAHDRIANLRRIAKNPYGRQFSGFNEWKFAGHVLLSTVAEPALVVAQVYRAATTIAGDDDAVRQVMTDQRLLPANDTGALVFRVALKARAIIVRRDVPLSQVQATLDRTSDALACVAKITSQDVADEGLARISMTTQWFGLEPTEIATYIAIELLKALGSVEELVEAALEGRRIARPIKKLPDTDIWYATQILRAEGKPDRDAQQLGKVRGACGGLRPGNKGSRAPLVSLRAKTHDQVVAKAVGKTFGIDASRLFRR